MSTSDVNKDPQESGQEPAFKDEDKGRTKFPRTRIIIRDEVPSGKYSLGRVLVRTLVLNVGADTIRGIDTRAVHYTRYKVGSALSGVGE